MDAKLSKSQWRVRVAEAVNSYWVGRLTSEATLYSNLKNMNCTMLIPGKCHPLLFNPSGGVHKASRKPVRLRIATGTYILQCNRAIYNQFECDSTCNLSGDADETLSHFLLECKALQECRQPIVAAIESAFASLCVDLGICTLGVELVKLVIDRAIYLQFECDSTCNLCGDADETLSHFLLECKALQECRQPIVAAIESACASLCVDLGICTLGVELFKLVIDCSSVLAVHPEVKVAQLQAIQYHSTPLCYALHSLRFKKLGLVPKRKRRRPAKNQ